MSDLIRYSHTAKCDWPECDALGTADEWSGWPSYDTAIEVLGDLDNDDDWYHDSLTHKDYCGKHWHWEDDEPVPGPEYPTHV